MESITTANTDNFLDGLSEDNYCNIVTSLGHGNTITLNYNHRPSRGEPVKIELIQTMVVDIKQSIIQNIIENVSEQMQADTLVEFSSGFDKKRPMGLQDRIIVIKKLQYCSRCQGKGVERFHHGNNLPI